LQSDKDHQILLVAGKIRIQQIKHGRYRPFCARMQDCGIRLENWVEQISSRRRLQAKAEARTLRGQGQGHQNLQSMCPRVRDQSSRTPSLVCITRPR